MPIVVNAVHLASMQLIVIMEGVEAVRGVVNLKVFSCLLKCEVSSYEACVSNVVST